MESPRVLGMDSREGKGGRTIKFDYYPMERVEFQKQTKSEQPIEQNF